MIGLHAFTMVARPSTDASDSARLTSEAEISVSAATDFALMSLRCCESFRIISRRQNALSYAHTAPNLFCLTTAPALNLVDSMVKMRNA